MNFKNKLFRKKTINYYHDHDYGQDLKKKNNNQYLQDIYGLFGIMAIATGILMEAMVSLQ